MSLVLSSCSVSVVPAFAPLWPFLSTGIPCLFYMFVIVSSVCPFLAQKIGYCFDKFTIHALGTRLFLLYFLVCAVSRRLWD